MQVPVRLRRVAYRVAYRLLQVVWTVRRPAKVGVKCVLVNDGRILLVRHTYGNRSWDLPGGAVKRGEQPLVCARREMREELGIEGAQWTPLGAIRGVMHHRRDLIHCYRAELAHPAVELDLGELATAQWFPRGELPAQLAPYVTPILTNAPA